MMRKLFLVGGLIAIAGICGAPAFAAPPNSPDQARAEALGVPYTPYNWQVAHVQDRGCNACHGGNLAAIVSQVHVPRSKMPIHGKFATSYNIPMRVEDCLPCHANNKRLAFADAIHSIHLFSAPFTTMHGNCASCHAVVKGRFLLYDDETRYDIMSGIQHSPTPAFTK